MPLRVTVTSPTCIGKIPHNTKNSTKQHMDRICKSFSFEPSSSEVGCSVLDSSAMTTGGRPCSPWLIRDLDPDFMLPTTNVRPEATSVFSSCRCSVLFDDILQLKPIVLYQGNWVGNELEAFYSLLFRWKRTTLRFESLRMSRRLLLGEMGRECARKLFKWNIALMEGIDIREDA